MNERAFMWAVVTIVMVVAMMLVVVGSVMKMTEREKVGDCGLVQRIEALEMEVKALKGEGCE